MPAEWKNIHVEWIKDMAFTGYNQAGAEIQVGTLDGEPGVGPMELLLMGLAGCTGMDIVSILGKKRQPLEKFQVRVRGKRAEDYPMVYTHIEVTYLLWGELDPKAVEHAIQLSEEKYCSASIMLGAVAKITSSYKILAASVESSVSQESVP